MGEELATSFSDVRVEVERIKEALDNMSDETVELEVGRMAALWDHISPFNPEKDENMCSICHEPLVQPVLFRGCVGRHFHCSECRGQALAANHTTCPICRQPAR